MKKLLLLAGLGFAGYVSAASPVEEQIKETPKVKEVSFYKYYYGMGAVDTANGTCFTYGQYTCLDDDSFCLFKPHDTGGTVPTTCLGDGNYQA